jgi:hypothetical protein
MTSLQALSGLGVCGLHGTSRLGDLLLRLFLSHLCISSFAKKLKPGGRILVLMRCPVEKFLKLFRKRYQNIRKRK